MYVFGVYSNHTVCQMPVERVYQISCGLAVQSCLPRGRSLRLGKSSARTMISSSSDFDTACVISQSNGV